MIAGLWAFPDRAPPWRVVVRHRYPLVNSVFHHLRNLVFRKTLECSAGK